MRLVMGASFRNIGEILELAGCDRSTIAPALLKELAELARLSNVNCLNTGEVKASSVRITESEFLWQHNQDPMAVDKLAEGIRKFAIDQEKLGKNDRRSGCVVPPGVTRKSVTLPLLKPVCHSLRSVSFCLTRLFKRKNLDEYFTYWLSFHL